MDRCIYSAMWILDLMAGRVLIWRTDTWLCQFDSLTLHRWNVQQVFQPESARLFYNVPIQGFDISIWRVGGFPFQAAAQPYRVSPVIGQPGSPCKTAVEPTFCGTKFLVLAIWLRDLFFFEFHSNIVSLLTPSPLSFGDFVQNFMQQRMSLEQSERSEHRVHQTSMVP